MVRLGPILCVSLQVANISAASRFYQRWFAWREFARGRFGQERPGSGFNRLARRRWIYLAPPRSDGIGGLRLIEGGRLPAPAPPLTTTGWAAAELSVRGVPEIAARLEGSPFRILGPPRALGSNPAIQAMQVAGPYGEVFYLTDVRAYEGKLDLVKARQTVDRIFIVVLATTRFAATRRFYQRCFALAPVSEHRVAIPVLNEAQELPPATRHRIGSMELAGSCLLEVDRYPDGAAPRRAGPDGLPAGVAMVTVAATGNRPRVADRCALADLVSGTGSLFRGPAGELLEVV